LSSVDYDTRKQYHEYHFQLPNLQGQGNHIPSVGQTNGHA